MRRAPITIHISTRGLDQRAFVELIQPTPQSLLLNLTSIGPSTPASDLSEVGASVLPPFVIEDVLLGRARYALCGGGLFDAYLV